MVGPAIVELTEERRLTLSEVNAAVNASINVTVSDKELYGREEYWTYPSGGYGDCEDIALEKRRRLVERGLPRAAMTMAIVHHKMTLMPHAVLLVEATSGTHVLDSLTDKVVIWSKAQLNYESRERFDGTWERYDQALWTFEKTVVPKSDGRYFGS
jgi:predicted transglutaminase-like cysteine proteinase